MLDKGIFLDGRIQIPHLCPGLVQVPCPAEFPISQPADPLHKGQYDERGDDHRQDVHCHPAVLFPRIKEAVSYDPRIKNPLGAAQKLIDEAIQRTVPMLRGEGQIGEGDVEPQDEDEDGYDRPPRSESTEHNVDEREDGVHYVHGDVMPGAERGC